MRMITRMSDRLLRLVVPEITAGACCPPDPWQQECSCTNHTIRAKSCSYNCGCKVFCGSCYNTYIGC
jgi:hypothetical protein